MPASITPALRSRCRGCLVGGAVGDALGAPVEFLSLQQIRAAFGPDGITGFAPAYGRLGAITDDTQMTMFTAEGLIRAWVRGAVKGICHPPSVVHYAYLDWLATQGGPPKYPNGEAMTLDGWLIELPALWSRRTLRCQKSPKFPVSSGGTGNCLAETGSIETGSSASQSRCSQRSCRKAEETRQTARLRQGSRIPSQIRDTAGIGNLIACPCSSAPAERVPAAMCADIGEHGELNP